MNIGTSSAFAGLNTARLAGVMNRGKRSMNKQVILAVLSLTVACDRNAANERRDLDDQHEAREEQLEAKHEREREALEKNQNREERALEATQRGDERNVEQRQDALRTGAAATAMAPATAAAVNDIATARCEREQRCGNIGAGKSYESATACSSKLSQELQEELNGYECPQGISSKELQECMKAIREEECNSPLDKLARLAACRDSDLCKN